MAGGDITVSGGAVVATTGPITRATRPVGAASAEVTAEPVVVAVICLPAFRPCWSAAGQLRGLVLVWVKPGQEAASASAPDTISLISWVISD